MPVTISAEQREALYAQVLDHLSGIGDLFLVIEAGDWRGAGPRRAARPPTARSRRR